MIIASGIIIVTTTLSLLSCFIVLFIISFDPLVKESLNLQLIFRLLVSNCLLNLVVLFYNVADSMPGTNLGLVCATCLPLEMYFFLTSFGWTVMLALRFRKSHEMQDGRVLLYRPSIPLWGIWVISLVLILPTVILNSVEYSSLSAEETGTSICSYNHDETIPVTIDIITVQFPLCLTILVNIHSYFIGLRALQDSPQSVVARQMRRVGGYLFILLLVWLPNIAFNLVSIITDTNSHFVLLFVVGVCLTTSQVSFIRTTSNEIFIANVRDF